MNIDVLISQERDKLEQMIITKEKYSKILKQSQKLDYYINEKMKELIK